jgi:hypothetical protein
MHSKNSKKIFFLVKLPLLLLYFAFSIVQLSFNFDIPANTNKSTITISSFKTEKNTTFLSKNHKKERSTKIRLNKRFQPENALCCSSFTLRPVNYIPETSLPGYTSASIPSVIITANPLRGPPALLLA